MNKLYISLLSTILCVQQIQSMELAKLKTPPSNDDGYTIVYKNINERPKPTPISKKFNALSEKLYDENITDTEIRELVKNGAELNYQKSGNNGPVIFDFAYNNSPQGIKNMKTMIELGAAIHNIEDQKHTPLTIALQRDQFLRKDFTEMIQCLIPHENPIVTVYEKTEDLLDCEPHTYVAYSQEKEIREYLISRSLCYPNIATIKLLLKLGLMTASRGLKAFVYFEKPNQEILNFLLENGAQYNNDMFAQIMPDGFPSDQYIDFLEQICRSGAFDAAALERMNRIKTKVDTIVKSLEHNGSHQEK